MDLARSYEAVDDGYAARGSQYNMNADRGPGEEYGVWWVPPIRIEPAPTSSLEFLLHQAGPVHGVVDFRSIAPAGEWLQGRLVSQPLGYAHMIATRPQHMDGIVLRLHNRTRCRGGALMPVALLVTNLAGQDLLAHCPAFLDH